MNRRIDAHIARTQFGQLMDLAVENNERFNRRSKRRTGRRHHERAGLHPHGGAAARLALQKPGPAPNGVDWTRWTPDEINAEIAEHRREKKSMLAAFKGNEAFRFCSQMRKE